MRVALALLTGVWSLLLAGRLAAAWLGAELAALVAFAAATALVCATRRRRRAQGCFKVWVFGAAAGYAAFPACVALISVLGLAAGLAPRGLALPGRGGPALWLAALVFAPIFEEILYRERLLHALRSRSGPAAAVVATSALFALPHLEPWAVLGAAAVGAGLALSMLTGRSTGLCISVHAGLNLASLLCGAPPLRWCLAPWGSAAVASALAFAAWAALKRSRQRA